MRKLKEALLKRKRLEYVSVWEEVEFKLWMRNWKDGHPHRNNNKLLQNQQIPKKGFLRTDERKSKNSIPRMLWFRALVTVEILNVHCPFITWRYKEGSVYWWIKLQNLSASKEKDKSKFFFGITYKKRKFIIHPEYFDSKNIFSHPFIQNLYLSRKIKKAPKNIYRRKVSNSRYIKYNSSLSRMVKQNTVEGHIRKTKLYYNQVGLVILLSSVNHNSTS